MNNTTAQPSLAQTVFEKIPRYASSIRIWESLFALPFCFIGMVLAAKGWPGWHTFIWINIAIFGARTLAMSGNRVINAREDALNPRTQNRHLPQGTLKNADIIGMMVVSSAIFLVGAW